VKAGGIPWNTVDFDQMTMVRLKGVQLREMGICGGSSKGPSGLLRSVLSSVGSS